MLIICRYHPDSIHDGDTGDVTGGHYVLVGHGPYIYQHRYIYMRTVTCHIYFLVGQGPPSLSLGVPAWKGCKNLIQSVVYVEGQATSSRLSQVRGSDNTLAIYCCRADLWTSAS